MNGFPQPKSDTELRVCECMKCFSPPMLLILNRRETLPQEMRRLTLFFLPQGLFLDDDLGLLALVEFEADRVQLLRQHVDKDVHLQRAIHMRVRMHVVHMRS